MLRLNLVSDELKKEIQLRYIYDMIKRIIFIFIVFTVFVSIILISANYTLEAYYEPIVKTQNASLNSRYDEEVKMINEKINAIEKIQKEHIYAKPTISEIFNYSGEGINIEAVKLKNAEKKFYVRGIASNRDNLNNFKIYLEKSDHFESVNMPTVNIFKKEDISFDIEIDIKI